MSFAEQLWGYGGGDPYENNGSFPGLQFNPAPGRVQAVQDVLDDLGRANKDIRSAMDVVVGIHNGSSWAGEAAEGFREKTACLPGMLATAGLSFQKATEALTVWHSQLETMQSRAGQHEQAAKAARERADRASKNPNLGLLGDGSLNLAELVSDEQIERHNRAVEELDAANAELEGIISRAGGIRTQHEELAGTVAAVLKDAGEQAPDAPGLLDSLKNLAMSVLTFQNELGSWIKKHANAIAAIGDVLSLVSTTIGTIGMAFDVLGFGLVGGPLGGIATGFSGAALVAHGAAKLAGADVSAETLGWDGLGVITGGVGSAALKDGGKLLAKIPVLTGVERGATGVGAGHTILGLFADDSVLKHFTPQDDVQRKMSIGGTVPLFLALKNAWDSGSEKDRSSQ
ncbi:putative T7SS-secreted protein [Streptomyces sp. NPDC001793]|uniref:putative T7SS-secreted protein n=1 Tax=Streptomyces sp. NPDC001793 TaxID=3154657 RepID=UPI00331C8AF8